MGKLAVFVVFTALCGATALHADDNFCRKCEVLREYHRDNPSQYEYYDDYLKDIEENGAEAVNPNPEDLPPEVRRIMESGKEPSQ